MPVATQLSHLGVAKEVTRGAGVVPSVFIPVKTITPEDAVKYLPVDVFKGAMPKIYGEVQSFKNTTFDMAGPVFPDTIGWPLMGVLGDVVTTASRSVTDGVTTSASATITSATAAFAAADVGKSISSPNIPAGAFIFSVTNATTAVLSQNATATGTAQSFTIGAPQTHVGSLLNSGNAQPTSHTLTDFYAVTQARQYAGIQWREVDFKFVAEGLLEHSSKAVGLVPSAPVAKPTQSFSTLLPVPTWQGVVTIGGTVQAKTFDINVTITRTHELVPAIAATQQYQAVFIGEAVVKFKLMAFIDDDTELLRMLNNTQPSLNVNWTAGSGASATQLIINMQQAAYLKAKINRGKQYVTIDLEGESVANTVDVGASGGFSVIKATLGNSTPAATYV